MSESMHHYHQNRGLKLVAGRAITEPSHKSTRNTVGILVRYSYTNGKCYGSKNEQNIVKEKIPRGILKKALKI